MATRSKKRKRSPAPAGARRHKAKKSPPPATAKPKRRASAGEPRKKSRSASTRKGKRAVRLIAKAHRSSPPGFAGIVARTKPGFAGIVARTKSRPLKVVTKVKLQAAARKNIHGVPRARTAKVKQDAGGISGRERFFWEKRLPHAYGELHAPAFMRLMGEIFDRAIREVARGGAMMDPGGKGFNWSAGAFVCVSRKPNGGAWSDWECEDAQGTPLYAVASVARKNAIVFVELLSRGARDGRLNGGPNEGRAGEYRFWIRGLWVAAEFRRK